MPNPAAAWLVRTFRFPAFNRLWRFLVVLAVYSLAVSVYEYHVELTEKTPPTPRVAEVVLSSLLFGILLQFRTNTAYDRWYEARRLWGTLVNVSRNIVLKTAQVVCPGEADEQEVRRLVGEFAVALRQRLGATEARPGHAPMQAAAGLYALLSKWGREGRVSTWEALAFDAELRQFMDVCGACERIRSTPLVTSYKGLLRKGIGLYLLAVPWLIVGDIGFFTVPVTLVVGYVLIALELIADDIEDPFGYGPDDLPLDAVVRVIQTATTEHPTGRWPVPGGVVTANDGAAGR